MAQKPRINNVKLLKMIHDDGLTQTDAARHFGVTSQAVCKRLREIRARTTKAVIVKEVGQIIDQKIDALSQLYNINKKANELLLVAESQDDRPTILRCMAEIRSQLDLQLKIYATLYDLQAAEEFQNAILDTIKEVSPDVRKRVIQKLNENRAVRSAVRFN